MRRSLLSPAIIIAVFLALVSPTSASAATTDYGAGGSNGVFYISPSNFNDGDRVTLSANFPSDQKGTKVTFYKSVGDFDGPFDEVGSVSQANTNGNAYLKNYLLEGSQTLFARTSKDKKTQRFVVDFGGTPSDCPVAGSLTSSPKTVTPGATASLFANFLTDQAGKTITFYEVNGDDSEVSLGTQSADQYGNASFDVTVDDETKYRARTSPDPAKCTKPLTITPKPIDPNSFSQSGTAYALPGDPREGEIGQLAANFASSYAGLDVSFFREVSPGNWESLGSDVSNSSGNAYLPDYTFDGPVTFFGLTETGVRTPVESITPTTINTVRPGGPATLGKNILYVVTNDRTLPKTKGVDHPGATAWSTDGGATVTPTYELETLAVRGNTTALLAKKSFKLKFDSKQAPFGLKKDKTWALQANYNDRSAVRNFASFDLGSKMDKLKWTSKGAFTELFVNGDYRGSYELIQTIKIDKDRLNINKETGQIIEFDPWWREDGVPGMEGVGAFARLDYSWKDPDEFKKNDDGSVDQEGLTTAKLSAMKSKIRQFEDVLYGKNVATGTGKGTRKNWRTYKYTEGGSNDWTTYLDLDSAVDYYLVNEFTKDTDSDMYRSNFFFTDNVYTSAKLFMGPVWDFDRSAGARNSSTMPTLDDKNGWWLRGIDTYHNTSQIHWYTQITDDPRFIDALEARWAEKKNVFLAMSGGSAAGNVTDTVSRGLEALGGGGAGAAARGKQVVANDKKKWPDSSAPLKPRASTHNNFPAADSKATSELGWLRDWYKGRYDWMDSQLR